MKTTRKVPSPDRLVDRLGRLKDAAWETMWGSADQNVGLTGPEIQARLETMDLDRLTRIHQAGCNIQRDASALLDARTQSWCSELRKAKEAAASDYDEHHPVLTKVFGGRAPGRRGAVA